MRKFQFRIWDKTGGLSTNLNLGGISVAFGLFPNGIIMQYTGFKDKNGTEIYEGDILNPGYRKVEWDKHTAGFFVEYGFGKRDEVVGNIYENPELLK